MNLNNRPAKPNRTRQSNVDVNSREYQEQVLTRSRGFLLTIIVFTIINLVLLVLKQGTQFLFSASVPYYMTLLGMSMDSESAAALAVGQNATIALVIAVVILLVYLACWILSAKKVMWLNIGIVLFVLDTAVLIYACLKVLDSPLDGIVDLLAHVLIIWEMSKGVTAAKNLKSMPENAA